jgi:oxygen-dependent protoporphyrinogen oxidase
VPVAAVIGAGLSGLTAAYRLAQRGWEVDVFERAEAVGGRTRTVRAGGYTIDTGASALSSSYNASLALVAEVGLNYISGTGQNAAVAGGQRVARRLLRREGMEPS